MADTENGSVRGSEGFYHYRQYDAAELARTSGLEDVWFLLEHGRLPSTVERDEFGTAIASDRLVPVELHPLVDAVAGLGGPPLAQL